MHEHHWHQETCWMKPSWVSELSPNYKFGACILLNWWWYAGPSSTRFVWYTLKFGCGIQLAECPTILISSGLFRRCLKIPNPVPINLGRDRNNPDCEDLLPWVTWELREFYCNNVFNVKTSLKWLMYRAFLTEIFVWECWKWCSMASRFLRFPIQFKFPFGKVHRLGI